MRVEPINRARRDHPAVVLDLSANGIGVARSLKRRGIPVYAFDTEAKYKIGKTRYARCGVCPHPVYEAPQLLQFLLELGGTFPQKAVLYAGSDDYVEFVSRNRDRLGHSYSFLLPDHALIEAVLDKRLTYQLARHQGVPCPQTFVVDRAEQLEAAIPHLAFPIILKPVFSSDFRKRLNKKAIVVKSPLELRQAYPYYRQFGDILLQELIPGNEECLIGVATLFDENMTLIGLFSGQKIHQYPPYFGSGTAAVSRRDDEAVEATISFFQAVKFMGLAKIEYKRDPRDGQLKFIEINARTWFWNSLAARCGVDLSYLYYLSMTGQNPEPAITQIDGVKWVYFIRDFLAFWTMWKDGNITVREWLKSLQGKKEYALFVWDDPMPFIRSVIAHLKPK